MRTGSLALALILLGAATAARDAVAAAPVEVSDGAWQEPPKADPDAFVAAEDAKVRAVRAAAQATAATGADAAAAPRTAGAPEAPPSKPPPAGEDKPPAVPVKRVVAQPLPPPEGISESPPLPKRWIAVRHPDPRPIPARGRGKATRSLHAVPIPVPKPEAPRKDGLSVGKTSRALAARDGA